ncbi:MAG TPA: LptF/LptG family permease [Panacibacter sp.]|nr:LptF/LptG family permease [Panacibacter sp.]
MKKLDWYILKKFLTTFFFAIFLFTIIAVAVDISEKTDDFVASGLSAKEIIMQYYIGFVPYIIALLFPLFVFIAVIFFTSKMAVQSEMIAILASGTSFNRMMRPYWIGGIVLGLLALAASNFFVPKANEIRTTFEARYVNANSTYNPLQQNTRNIYFRIDSFTYAGVRNYDTSAKSGGPFFMHRVRNNQMLYNLRSESIRWDTAKKNWILQNAIERNINGLKENVSLTYRKDMKFNFKPFDLSHDTYAKDKLTSPELENFIKLESLRGSEDLNSLLVEKYRRYATPVAVLLLSLIGAVVACRKVRGGSGAHIAIGFVLASAFILMDRFSTIFSTKGHLQPIIAAWIPDLVFFGVALYLYKRAPK